MEKKLERLGEKHTTNEGYEIEIIEYFNIFNCTIRFNDGQVVKKRDYYDIINGRIKNYMHPSVCGVGFIGIGKYKVRENKTLSYIYSTWRSMFVRCYNNIKPTYIDCTVDERWHNFQIFAEWHDKNWKLWMDKSWHLDKDILMKGNKVYSPEMCAFVHSDINMLFTKRQNKRGDFPIGVKLHKPNNKYISSISLNNKQKHLKLCDTPEEAFQVYKIAKETEIKNIADKWKGLISDQVYQALYNYQVEITD